jgi:hypothetical protein
MYHGKATIYERATYSEAFRFARELRSKDGVEKHVYTDKGDASTWNKATWNEFYADLIKEFKEVCDD